MADETSAPADTEATQQPAPDHAPQQVLADLAHQLRSKDRQDLQTGERQVYFTEAEVNAMADALEGLAQHLTTPAPAQSGGGSEQDHTTDTGL